MKRIGAIFDRIIDYENLWEAYLNAKKGKRFRGEVLEFTNNLEENLIDIQNELIHKMYQVGRYREFYIHEPKKRLIMALPFRDRVVQWAVYQVIEPMLDKQFIEDSFACRTGKGVQKAADRLQYWSRKMSRTNETSYFLKMDMSKYFYRIDHDVLMTILERKIKDPDLLWLLEAIIRSEDTSFGVPIGDHFFERNRVEGMGMPIGNLLSQLFANLYLNELDQYAKNELKIKHYVRYMDDVVILHTDKQELWQILEEVDAYIGSVLRLQLNNKTQIRTVRGGIDFVGFRIWPTHRKLSKVTTKKMRRRFKGLRKAFARGADIGEIKPVVASYLGLMQHANCYLLRKKLMANFILKRGEG